MHATTPGGFVLPQFGIFAQGTHAHHFLEFDLEAGITPAAAVVAFRRLRTPDVSAGGVNLVIAFGADAWRGAAPAAAPDDLAAFEPVTGSDGHAAPATQHDAWLWISGAEPDVTWQSARAAAELLRGTARVAAEQEAFTYRGGRDITGFIDGTANPQVARAGDVALIPPGAVGQGGSHVLTMRWVHDLVAFNRLSLEDQERVFGRTKADSTELTPGEKPANAHIARVETTVDGEELEIFRRSVPYGTAEESGLNFVAFSSARSRYDRMLSRMFGAAPDGPRDRLTDFSRPVSGAYYFAPSLTALNELAGRDP
ncbi:MAG TPA: Dyp-type peroxidase [Solirubrobacteraceae bacterium]|nr:Dyp-type peroxidase [Solirubrobacteraceae bacterium]